MSFSEVAPAANEEYEALLQFLYRSPVAVIQTDADGQVSFMTAAAARDLMPLAVDGGLDNLFELLEPHLAGFASRARGATVLHGRRVPEPSQFVTPGPVRRILQVEVVPVSTSDLLFMLSDVTAQVDARARERGEAERMISALLADLDRAITVAGLLLARTDLRSGATTIDPACTRWLPEWGDAAGRLGTPLEALVEPDDREAFREDVQRAIAGDLGPIREFRLHKGDGTMCWMTGRHFVERDPGGQPSVLLTLCIDVTEQHAVRRAQEAARVAEEASAAKSRFLAGVSHELRTPLNAVIGFSDLMLSDARHDLPEPQRRRLGHIRAAGVHLLALVGDLLDTIAIEDRRLTVKLEDVDIAEQLAASVSHVRASAELRKVGIDVALPAEPLRVRADPTRLRQVLTNVLSNAVKYNRSGGTVAVHAQQHAGRVAIRIEDTGFGMDAAQLQRLFQPFDRLGREQSGIDGLGLGMSIARQLVEAMEGRITVDSAPNVGTAFVIDLPAGQAVQVLSDDGAAA